MSSPFPLRLSFGGRVVRSSNTMLITSLVASSVSSVKASSNWENPDQTSEDLETQEFTTGNAKLVCERCACKLDSKPVKGNPGACEYATLTALQLLLLIPLVEMYIISTVKCHSKLSYHISVKRGSFYRNYFQDVQFHFFSDLNC